MNELNPTETLARIRRLGYLIGQELAKGEQPHENLINEFVQLVDALDLHITSTGDLPDTWWQSEVSFNAF
jgi:hypothetical protein